jgi:hypothetical protein
VVRDILNAKDAELVKARHMLSRKEEELRRLLHRWEEREGQLAKARAEVRADRAPETGCSRRCSNGITTVCFLTSVPDVRSVAGTQATNHVPKSDTKYCRLDSCCEDQMAATQCRASCALPWVQGSSASSSCREENLRKQGS